MNLSYHSFILNIYDQAQCNVVMPYVKPVWNKKRKEKMAYIFL